ncbi:MAG TPA: TRAP transporter small permease subunit [Thermoanaerobaculia bacterium]|jgi:TRAP-type mannitol/chloroaromatic compound transport system permease small subunit
MAFWLRISRALDRLSEWIGLGAGWLTLAMVLIGAYNAVVRKLGHTMGWTLSSNAYIELQWYLFSLVFLLGAAYALRRGAHVRVDVLYGRVGSRGRAWINLAGTVAFLIPFCVFVLWVSWPSVRNSWAVREVSPDPGGLPRYPIKTVILVAFALLLLQSVSEIVKQVAVLSGRADEDESAREAEVRA